MRCSIALVLCALLATQAAAQNGSNTQSGDTIVYGERAPRWAGQVTALTTNALLGALTAGIYQELRGGSFKDGFARGALGGGVTYVGKRVAARQWAGAGLIGREIGAVGTSMTRNASYGRPTFNELIFPVGPMQLRVWPREARWHLNVDLVATGYTLYGLTQSELAFAPRASLSSGTPVFRTDNQVIVTRGSRSHAGGFAAAGVVFQSFVPAWGTPFLDRALAHERVHVVQEDQLYYTMIEPATDWAVSKLPVSRKLTRHIELNISSELLGIFAGAFRGHIDRPWELEATYLSR